MSETCPACGTKKAYVAAGIGEFYCPNEDCDYERKQLFAGIRAAKESREREEYERLKAKYEPPKDKGE